MVVNKSVYPTQSVRVSAKRMYILGVPIDMMPPDSFKKIVPSLLNTKKVSQIIFVEWWDVIRAKFNSEYLAMLRKASLVIPTAPSIIVAAKILLKKTPVYYHPFRFVIKLLTVLEQLNKSLYLIGLDLVSIKAAENNLTNTFPQLKIVGRHPGYFSPVQEKSLVVAIRKSSPTILLGGPGLYSRDAWFYRIKHKIQSGIVVYSKTALNILANRKKPPSSSSMLKLRLQCVSNFLKSPWRIYRFPIFIVYFLIIIFQRIFRMR